MHTIADLLRHARELLDIIDDEIADVCGVPLADARAVLAQLRGRLESLEQDVMPIRH
jgi:BMFP domain-containing protein YqiC